MGEVELDDLDGVKPLLDEARAGVARGETLSHEEFKARAARKMSGFRK